MTRAHPPIEAPHLPLVEAARGLAALFVVLVHLEQYTGAPGFGPVNELFELGRGGVALFFTLSAFLLYRPFVAHRLGRRPPVPLQRYARNRLLRIFPTYLVAMAVCLMVGWVAFEPRWLWSHLTLTHIYMPPEAGVGIGVSWSLATELSFYLVLPGYAWLMARVLAGRRQPVRLELALLAGVALLTVPLNRWLATLPSVGLEKSLPGTWYFFAPGLALAVVSLSRDPDAERVRRWIVAQRRWLWAAASVLVVAAAAHGNLKLGSVHPFYGVVSTLIFAPIALQPPSRWSGFRVLSSAPARWLGLVSYSLYLYHYFIVTEIGRATGLPGLPLLLVGVGASLAVAWLSYRFVEEPFLRRKQRITAATGRPATDRPDPGVAA